MRDPLFQVDKLFLDASDLVKPELFEEYNEALDRWNGNVAGANGEAFISSFGEYNPGGGTEQIERYLERSRVFATKAKKDLEVIAKALELDLKACAGERSPCLSPPGRFQECG